MKLTKYIITQEIRVYSSDRKAVNFLETTFESPNVSRFKLILNELLADCRAIEDEVFFFGFSHFRDCVTVICMFDVVIIQFTAIELSNSVYVVQQNRILRFHRVFIVIILEKAPKKVHHSK